MINKESNWRRVCAAVATMMFLLTSCPAPVAEPEAAVAVEDTGKIKWCRIDDEGIFTDEEDAAYGKLYWVEKDGKVQPGLVSVGRKDNMVNVVNFVDTDSGNRFRMSFMDRANLPYRMVVTCKDADGKERTLIGSEVRYNQERQELSLRFTDRDNPEQSAVMSGVSLNSGLFNLDDQSYSARSLSQEQYMVTMAVCLLYAIGESDATWSEGTADFAVPVASARWSLGSFLKAAFAVTAVVAFVVAAVLAPAVVVGGGAVAIAVTSANAGWAVATMVDAAAATAAMMIPEPKVYTDTGMEYGNESGEIPPIIAVWQVGSDGKPADNPGEDDWCDNDGVVHLHYDDTTEALFCVRLLNGTPPVSLEFGQSMASNMAHTVMLLGDLSTKEKIFEPNTKSSLSPVPDTFYLSISRKSDFRSDDPYRFFTFISFSAKTDDMVALVNGEEGLLTRLEKEDGTPAEEKLYKNIFKVNACTVCPGAA